MEDNCVCCVEKNAFVTEDEHTLLEMNAFTLETSKLMLEIYTLEMRI